MTNHSSPQNENNTFPSPATLPQLQEYVQKKCQERGFDSANDLEIFLLLSEEIGELAKAMRNRLSLFAENGQAKPDNTAEELADVLSYLLDLANRTGVSLEEAFRRKEAINDQRHWS